MAGRWRGRRGRSENGRLAGNRPRLSTASSASTMPAPPRPTRTARTMPASAWSSSSAWSRRRAAASGPITGTASFSFGSPCPQPPAKARQRRCRRAGMSKAQTSQTAAHRNRQTTFDGVKTAIETSAFRRLTDVHSGGRAGQVLTQTGSVGSVFHLTTAVGSRITIRRQRHGQAPKVCDTRQLPEPPGSDRCSRELRP